MHLGGKRVTRAMLRKQMFHNVHEMCKQMNNAYARAEYSRFLRLVCRRSGLTSSSLKPPLSRGVSITFRTLTTTFAKIISIF